jgi:bromodomain-containing factor 1
LLLGAELCLLMAVMTSQHPDGVAFDQKITPVPSSDKMALDLEING